MSHSTSHRGLVSHMSQHLTSIDAIGVWVALISLRLILGWDFLNQV